MYINNCTYYNKCKCASERGRQGDVERVGERRSEGKRDGKRRERGKREKHAVNSLSIRYTKTPGLPTLERSSILGVRLESASGNMKEVNPSPTLNPI